MIIRYRTNSLYRYGIDNNILMNDRLYDEVFKCLLILEKLLEKKVDINSEFFLNAPKDYEDYCAYHDYKYNEKTKLTEIEFYEIMEALNGLI